MSLTVFFNGFWPGFLDGTNPNHSGFFLDLFRRVFKTTTPVRIETNSSLADILCESHCKSSMIDFKPWKYSFFFTGESVLNEWNDSVYSKFRVFLGGISCKSTNSTIRIVRCPLFVSYLFCNPQHSFASVNVVPTYNVCAVMGQGITAGPRGETRIRFLDKLQTKIPVVYGGRFRNNIGYTVSGDHNSKSLIHFYSQYKFVVCMENSKEDYYITEKICNGLFAGVIPIYWGSPNIHEYFNPKRFLWLKDDSDASIDSLVNTITTMTDSEYLDIVKQPVLIKPIEEIINDISIDIQT